jgi:DNA-binding MarR family transcriptional regulator
MHLAEVLQTSKFRNAQHQLLLYLLYTRSVMHLEQKRRLKPWNITPEQYNILRILRGQHGKPMALNDLTCRMIDPTSNASRLVEKLRTKGFVTRKASRMDRRRVDVALTPAGTQCVEAATAQLLELERLFEAAIPEALAHSMNTALDAFHAARLIPDETN